ncbi:MAG: hypothetical protein U1E61_20180 [Bradyrhizobium sp.]
MIDSREATEALAEIDDMVRRVRQSRIYELASQLMVMWGALVFAGYLLTWLAPRYAGIGWIAVYVIGLAGWAAFSAINRPTSGVRSFDLKFLLAFAMFLAFGIFCCWLGRFDPRQLSAFWPVYFMLFYSIAGLWFGYAFIAIGLAVIALTLAGYFWIGGAFDLWMAFVNGGGLILGGLWMRRS